MPIIRKVIVLLAGVVTLNAAAQCLPYKNPMLPTEVRVEDLLGRMTLEEKIAQMSHIHSWQIFDGQTLGDRVILIDEIHTPDSSRYFYADGYEQRFIAGEPQRQLSKEFVRQWLMDNGFMGKAGQKVPEMTPEVCESISSRYIELYEHITGKPFVKAPEEHLAQRIEHNVLDCLDRL